MHPVNSLSTGCVWESFSHKQKSFCPVLHNPSRTFLIFFKQVKLIGSSAESYFLACITTIKLHRHRHFLLRDACFKADRAQNVAILCLLPNK